MNESDIIEYMDSIMKCDYWIQRKATFESMMLATGLYIAIYKKGLITKEEYEIGIKTAKELYKDQSREMQENYDKAVSEKEKLEKKIEKLRKQIENPEQLFEKLFGR